MTYIEKTKIKVRITLLDEKIVWGFVYLAEGERVSDVLNKPDPFLPIQILEDKTGRKYEDVYKMVFINKSQIYRVED